MRITLRGGRRTIPAKYLKPHAGRHAMGCPKATARLRPAVRDGRGLQPSGTVGLRRPAPIRSNAHQPAVPRLYEYQEYGICHGAGPVAHGRAEGRTREKEGGACHLPGRLQEHARRYLSAGLRKREVRLPGDEEGSTQWPHVMIGKQSAPNMRLARRNPICLVGTA